MKKKICFRNNKKYQFVFLKLIFCLLKCNSTYLGILPAQYSVLLLIILRCDNSNVFYTKKVIKIITFSVQFCSLFVCGISVNKIYVNTLWELIVNNICPNMSNEMEKRRKYAKPNFVHLTLVGTLKWISVLSRIKNRQLDYVCCMNFLRYPRV